MNGMISRCEICFQDLNEKDKKYFCNNCGNDFHNTCIATAINQNNVCPICKAPFVVDFKTLAKESHIVEHSSDEENSGNDFPSGVIVAFYVLLFSITVTIFQNFVGLIGILGSLVYIGFVIWDYKSIS